MQSQATATLVPVFPGWSGLSSSQPRPLEAAGESNLRLTLRVLGYI